MSWTLTLNYTEELSVSRVFIIRHITTIALFLIKEYWSGIWKLNFNVTIIIFITPVGIKKSLIELIEEFRKFDLNKTYHLIFWKSAKIHKIALKSLITQDFSIYCKIHIHEEILPFFILIFQYRSVLKNREAWTLIYLVSHEIRSSSLIIVLWLSIDHHAQKMIVEFWILICWFLNTDRY